MAGHTTILVLLSGIFGGLGIVISFILVYKHCCKKPAETGLEGVDGEKTDAPRGSLLDKASEYAANKFGSNNNVSDCNSDVDKDRESKTRLLSPDSVNLTERKSLKDDQTNFDENDSEKRWKEHQDDVQWPIERENSSQGSILSRPASRQALHTAVSFSSRRNLQDSIDSSVCTDSKSEITMIEVPPVDQAVSEKGVIQHISQDTSRSVPAPVQYLSAFRPVPERRRQLSHPEASRSLLHHSMQCDKLYKSCDEPAFQRSKNHDDATDTTIASSPLKGVPIHYQLENQSSPVQWTIQSYWPIPTPHQSEEQPLHRVEHTIESPSDTSFQEIETGMDENSTNIHHDIWALRTTFEKNDRLAQTNACVNWTENSSLKEDMTAFPGDGEVYQTHAVAACSVVCASFDSDSSNNTPEPHNTIIDEKIPAGHLLHPLGNMHSNRRQYFQRLVSNRHNRRFGGSFDVNSSTEKSFDSFDTTTTDGAHSSESSRVEVTTTSFESSTTNEYTDSSMESYNKRQHLIDSRNDSGYRSAEMTSFLSRDSTVDRTFSVDEDNTLKANIPATQLARTASHRRRDFRKMYLDQGKEVKNEVPSFNIETIGSNNCTGPESIDDDSLLASCGKPSKFLHVFRSHSQRNRHKPAMHRDYSVDARSDALFKEFTRIDPELESENVKHSRSRSCTQFPGNSNPKSKVVQGQSLSPIDWQLSDESSSSNNLHYNITVN